ncbi:MAG: MFS transporter [Holophagales bacterium]|nr:MFS transporter [Holophagales bacterium]
MSPERVSLARLWALMATVFVDMVGFLIVLPLLPFYATRLGASAFLVGAMVSAFAVAQLATAPIWGRFSDRIGRRPMLLLGLAISVAAHLLFAFACSDFAMGQMSSAQTLAILCLSRLVQGAGGATTGVVQAYVGDAVVPEERAKALGWITAATSAGVMLGPAIGSLASTLGAAAPGLVAAGLCALNLAFAWRWLPESTSHEERADAAAKKRVSLRGRMLEVAAHPQRPVARLIWIYAVPMMAFMAMNGILALYLQDRFAFTEKTIGYLYTFVGTVSLVMRSLILGPAVRRLGEVGAMRSGLAALVVGFVLMPLATSTPLFVATIVLVPVGTALLFPATTSLVSRFAPRAELGATMGVQQAFGGVARLIGPLWAGAAFQALGPASPFWISSVLVLGTLAAATGLQPPARAESSPVATPAASGSPSS